MAKKRFDTNIKIRKERTMRDMILILLLSTLIGKYEYMETYEKEFYNFENKVNSFFFFF